MSDKEFDKQFKDKFEGFEPEPSAFIWSDIDAELAASEKKPFPWFSVAAASMVAILTAGILFGPEKQHMKLYSKVKTEKQDLSPKKTLAKNAPVYEVAEIEPAIARPLKDLSVESGLSKVKLNEKEFRTKELEETDNTIASSQLTSEESVRYDQPVDITIPSRSDEAFSAAAKSSTMLAFHSLPDDTTSDRSRHKIRSVGDLVNFVVSKVDKRKNKIIEFSKDDEGEEISGLNLGVLQYRTRNN
ncbi:hypothetical protein [Desertivirga arenae]|uniref:hypothetical protein n=1 Tax=Desertivirga arenae TaxID=2810309 RepID=UPI001A968B40|nr:hypothetical protein [Pedobacter sp. SYSU D00823]